LLFFFVKSTKNKIFCMKLKQDLFKIIVICEILSLK
jgi:hypothetical protein